MGNSLNSTHQARRILRSSLGAYLLRRWTTAFRMRLQPGSTAATQNELAADDVLSFCVCTDARILRSFERTPFTGFKCSHGNCAVGKREEHPPSRASGRRKLHSTHRGSREMVRESRACHWLLDARRKVIWLGC